MEDSAMIQDLMERWEDGKMEQNVLWRGGELETQWWC